MTVIEAIALGNTKPNDIYTKTGIDRTKISVYLRNLIDFNIIEKEYPFFTRNTFDITVYTIMNQCFGGFLMAYSYYMPADVCSYCPFMAGGYIWRNPDIEYEQEDGVKKVSGKEVTYDKTQYRILPLLALPLLFAAAMPPGPYYGPPPFYYNYWYYYYR